MSAGINGSLKIYDVSGNEIVDLVGHTGRITALASNKNHLISGSDDQMIILWDLKSIQKTDRKKEIKPLFYFFAGDNNEWVIWTDQGFFNSSANGAKYIGYHLNRGLDKESNYVSLETLYSVFYKPNLVAKTLRGENLQSEYPLILNLTHRLIKQ